MKKNIENHEELIKQLALQGDPHAFFLLGTPYFRTRYQKERKNGSTHQDAQTRILAEAIELLENLQHVTPARFDAWFEEHCSTFTETPEEDKPGSVPDKKLAAETGAFLNHCSQELLRTGSDIKRMHRRRKRRFPHVLFQNKIIISIWILLGAVAFFFATAALMAQFRTAIVISLNTPGHQFSLRFPPVTPFEDNGEEQSPLDPLTISESIKPGAAPATSALSDTSTMAPRDTTRQMGAPSGAPSTGSMPPDQIKAVSAPAEVKRSLPPVVPRARMILPPSPPQVTEPVQSTGPVTSDPVNTPSLPVPPSPMQAPAEEPASSY